MPTDSTPETPLTRMLRWLLLGGFLVGIAAPGLVLALDPDSEAARQGIAIEARKPARAPGLPRDLAELEAFPDRFEPWFNDFIGFRATLIRWHNMLKLLGFGVSPSDTVLLGERGWMFYNLPDSVADYRGLRAFTAAELDAWQTAVEQRARWLSEFGCQYLFVVGPSKHSIYPEMMLDEQTRVTSTRRLDQLLGRLRERGRVNVLDLRPALIAAKDDAVLYYPHGTHWNQLGGYYAYVEIMNSLVQHDARLAPKPLDQFRLREQEGLIDSWARKLHLGDLVKHRYTTLFYAGPHPARRIEAKHLSQRWEAYTAGAPADDLPRGMLWRDSFGDNIRLLLALNFSRFTVGVNGRCTPEEFAQAVQRERPHYLVDEFVERALLEPPPAPLPEPPTSR